MCIQDHPHSFIQLLQTHREDDRAESVKEMAKRAKEINALLNWIDNQDSHTRRRDSHIKRSGQQDRRPGEAQY